jgi:hypothetical protein
MAVTATKEEALELLERTRADYLSRARYAAMRLYQRTGNPVCVDDVRRVVPPPASVDPRVMGAIFSGKQWLAVGFTVAKGHCHARPIRMFVPAPGGVV